MIDLSSFADDVPDTDAFAQEASWTHGGAPATINVILDTEYSAPEGVGITGVSDAAPVALCKASDVTGAARGDTLLVDGVTYYVTEAMPNGDGFTVLRLSRE